MVISLLIKLKGIDFLKINQKNINPRNHNSFLGDLMNGLKPIFRIY